ncbi:MAG: SIS domain-containing protein [Patescibacteria group bacterium]|nr:SIS domain-containing protein [Patescibacteria group bacterium]
MISLDDIKKILRLQGGDKVIISVNSLALQLEQSFNESLAVDFENKYLKKIENIVVCGMGGSRFPAFIIKELFKESLKKPVIINDNYNLPYFVNEKTLVILSSYSGTTEEVLAMANQAKEKKAKITGLTVGGELKDFFEKNNYPFYLIRPFYNPSNQPRIGFGYFVGGILGLLFKLNLIDEKKENIYQAIGFLKNKINDYKIEVETKKNKIKQLAQEIYQKYPFYIVSEHLAGVGNAVANQTNETAKSISDFRIIPELNHHLMEGLKFPEAIKNLLVFVFFYSSSYSLSIQKRYLITKEVVEKNQIKTIWFELEGKTKIEQAFELMAVGSFLSLYLSVLYEQDPKIIPYVDYFKKKLKEMK